MAESRNKEFSVSEIERLREGEGDRGAVVGRESKRGYLLLLLCRWEICFVGRVGESQRARR